MEAQTRDEKGHLRPRDDKLTLIVVEHLTEGVSLCKASVSRVSSWVASVHVRYWQARSLVQFSSHQRLMLQAEVFLFS